MDIKRANAHAGRTIGYCFVGAVPVVICIIIIILKLKSSRRARYQSSDSSSNLRSPRAPATYGRSRKKTLSRTALDEIPIYRIEKSPGSRRRSSSPDMERGISCQRSNTNRPRCTFTLEHPDQDLVLREPISSVGGSTTIDLVCAICTENYTEGQLVRSLACHHRYHAKCIDDWLVNAAGSCPLWYVRRACFRASSETHLVLT
ncbi:uncharacterized protein BO97DRAFT_433829 [Aspergillus homomorphus CBS 101889]|uniref:RING-type E3 ubiquitin transferase n=1 Tax=Aspergillus homomorphus (strain CBS 101889) TaxID=1450537 RepID=A0A395HZW8_ASPHC|nr:hypothetical protein BO97DRAFT_433829 [Aspergillus homomorphus CBS 101889]RAL13096.1 hypothetical protein BO97DRAFT_433829 [Aspergillus homomorphus CBS 101889]